MVTDVDGIWGYVTVQAGKFESEGGRHDPISILRLARLAVGVRAQHRGIGTALVRFVLQLALRSSDEWGCVGVVVDALRERVGFYGALGFELIDPIEGRTLMRPSPIVMFLSIGEIRRSAH